MIPGAPQYPFIILYNALLMIDPTSGHRGARRRNAFECYPLVALDRQVALGECAGSVLAHIEIFNAVWYERNVIRSLRTRPVDPAFGLAAGAEVVEAVEPRFTFETLGIIPEVLPHQFISCVFFVGRWDGTVRRGLRGRRRLCGG